MPKENQKNGDSMKDCFKSTQKKYCGISIWIYAFAIATLLVVIINFEGLKFGVSVAGFIGTAGVAIYTNYQAKMREINSRHFTEKREAYMILMNIIFDLIFDLILDTTKASPKKKTLSPDKLKLDMMEFKKGLIVWGSATVIQAWNDYEKLADKQPSGKKALEGIEKLLRAIREDLGHDNSVLEFGSLFGLILIAKDKGLIKNTQIDGKNKKA